MRVFFLGTSFPHRLWRFGVFVRQRGCGGENEVTYPSAQPPALLLRSDERRCCGAASRSAAAPWGSALRCGALPCSALRCSALRCVSAVQPAALRSDAPRARARHAPGRTLRCVLGQFFVCVALRCGTMGLWCPGGYSALHCTAMHWGCAAL